MKCSTLVHFNILLLDYSLTNKRKLNLTFPWAVFTHSRCQMSSLYVTIFRDYIHVYIQSVTKILWRWSWLLEMFWSGLLLFSGYAPA